MILEFNLLRCSLNKLNYLQRRKNRIKNRTRCTRLYRMSDQRKFIDAISLEHYDFSKLLGLPYCTLSSNDIVVDHVTHKVKVIFNSAQIPLVDEVFTRISCKKLVSIEPSNQENKPLISQGHQWSLLLSFFDKFFLHNTRSERNCITEQWLLYRLYKVLLTQGSIRTSFSWNDNCPKDGPRTWMPP